MPDPILHEVFLKTATNEDDCFILDVDLTDTLGERYRCDYVTRPDDEFGLNPTIQQWIADNPDFPTTAYVPPTQDEIRANMPALTARQFRLGLLSAGKTPSQVSALIAGMPDGPEKEAAAIEWEYATTFARLHPLVVSLSAAMGFTPEQVDAMWAAAQSI